MVRLKRSRKSCCRALQGEGKLINGGVVATRKRSFITLCVISIASFHQIFLQRVYESRAGFSIFSLFFFTERSSLISSDLLYFTFIQDVWKDCSVIFSNSKEYVQANWTKLSFYAQRNFQRSISLMSDYVCVCILPFCLLNFSLKEIIKLNGNFHVQYSTNKAT